MKRKTNCILLCVISHQSQQHFNVIIVVETILEICQHWCKHSLNRVLVTGDMNARTGNLPDFTIHSGNNCTHPNACDCISDWIPPIRSSKYNTVHEYGRELIELCKRCNLVIVNGRIESEKEGNFTRVGTTGRSVVDYLLAGKDIFDQVSHLSVDSDTVESDRTPLCYNICVDQSFVNK